MSAPAGWYPHPDAPGYEAFWDGTGWSQHVRRAETPAAPPPQPVWAQPQEDSWTSQAAGWDSAAETGFTREVRDERQRGRSLMPVLGAAVAVVVLIVGAFLVVGRFQGSSGSSSPEGVGNALMAAMEGGDVLGIIDVMHPAERAIMREPFMQGMKEMQRLGLIPKDTGASSKLFSLKVQNLSVRSEKVADDIAAVFINGEVTTSLNADLKLGPVFDGVKGWEDIKTVGDLMEELSPESSVPSTDQLEDFMITAVKVDGRWYASLGYTIAESIRRDSGASLPAAGVTLRGGSSPDEAVREAAKGVESLDLDYIVSVLHPGEFGALQRYGSAVLGDASAELRKAASENGFSWRITKLELEEREVSDQSASVLIKKVALEAFVPDHTVVLVLQHTGDDVRASVTVDGELQEFSLKDLLDQASPGWEEKGNVTETMEALLSVPVRKWGDGWYVAPLSGFTQYAITALQQVSQSDVRKAIEDMDLLSALDGASL